MSEYPDEFNELLAKFKEELKKKESLIDKLTSELRESEFQINALYMLLTFLRGESDKLIEDSLKEFFSLNLYAKNNSKRIVSELSDNLKKGLSMTRLSLELQESIKTFHEELDLNELVESLRERHPKIEITYVNRDEGYLVVAEKAWLTIGLDAILKSIEEINHNKPLNVWLKCAEATIDKDYYLLSIINDGVITADSNDYSIIFPYLFKAASAKKTRKLKSLPVSNRLEYFKVGLTCLGGLIEYCLTDWIDGEAMDSVNIYIPKKQPKK